MPAIRGDPTVTIEADMRALPFEARKAARPKLRKAGENIVGTARILAGWSTRIPPTIRVRTSFRVDREGVTIIAGGPKAPHARPYEGTGGKPSFKHPVHANPNQSRNEWHWVDQATRPFLLPAARMNSAATTALMVEALGEAAREIGFV